MIAKAARSFLAPCALPRPAGTLSASVCSTGFIILAARRLGCAADIVPRPSPQLDHPQLLGEGTSGNSWSSAGFILLSSCGTEMKELLSSPASRSRKRCSAQESARARRDDVLLEEERVSAAARRL